MVTVSNQKGTTYLRLDFGNMGAAKVGHALKVAPLGLCSADFRGKRAGEVVEEQVLARNWQPQQPVEKPPAPPKNSC